MVRFSPRREAKCSCRTFRVTERKPSKVKRPVGKPDRARAVAAALGPGTATTSTPASAQRRTRSSPGSLMAGMPASVTKAQLSPASSRSKMRSPLARLLCS